MAARANRKVEAFQAMHVPGAGFIMPNAWDAGSAILLADAGFQAIATTSGGIAFSLGRPDYGVRDNRLAVSRDAMLDRVREIVDAVDIPVSGDLEAGYGDEPAAVAETMRLAIEAGLAGGNIEDRIPGASGLYDEEFAVERIRAARAAIDAAGDGFVLTARSDTFLTMADGALADAIRRLNRYREAGADCLYAPGVNDSDAIRTLAREVDGPINVVMGLGSTALTVAALRDAGVARISLGGTFARAALGFVRQGARELIERGTLGFAERQIPQGELNTLFARYRSVAAGRTAHAALS